MSNLRRDTLRHLSRALRDGLCCEDYDLHVLEKQVIAAANTLGRQQPDTMDFAVRVSSGTRGDGSPSRPGHITVSFVNVPVRPNADGDADETVREAVEHMLGPHWRIDTVSGAAPVAKRERKTA
jgi:hypothetical protein